MSDHLVIDTADRILEIRFNRPDKRNAITNAMYGEIADALADAEARDDVRVVLFTGNGDAYTSGNDLADFAAIGTGQLDPSQLHVGRMLSNLSRMTKPVVAAVNGLAVGVGMTMLLHCDLVYLSDQAKLSVPFVNLALVPEAASSMLLQQRIGYARAFELFALGGALTASTAHELGIANAVYPADELKAASRKAAIELASRAPMALRRTKQLMRDPDSVAQVMARESSSFALQLQSAEAKEAFMAFFERRPPDFSKAA